MQARTPTKRETTPQGCQVKRWRERDEHGRWWEHVVLQVPELRIERPEHRRTWP
jgi:hypothetical protein